MSMFGLKEAEVAELVRAVAGRELDRAAIEERFARATWTGVAEPGDRVAGAMIEAIGAPAALTAVVERWAADKLVAALGENGAIDESDLSHGMDRWMPRLNSSAALIALRQAARVGAALIVPGDDSWPRALDDLEQHAPLAIWVRGRRGALAALERSIALVGARAATGYGEHITMESAAGLVDRGYAIVSGAAYGIDGMAHRAALASKGSTIAFLAGGVDRFYPSGHDELLTRIVEKGAVVSELPPGSPPTKWRFLQRNRLIAAASLATVVMEAGWRSGSLNTAHHAAQLGRPVGAVPGPVTSAASAGCHRLLREHSAECVTTADEMAELAPLDLRATRAVASASASASDASNATDATDASRPTPVFTRVADAMSTRAARTAPDIAARAGLSIAEVQSQLAMWELTGDAAERPKGWVKVAPKS